MKFHSIIKLERPKQEQQG